MGVDYEIAQVLSLIAVGLLLELREWHMNASVQDVRDAGMCQPSRRLTALSTSLDCCRPESDGYGCKIMEEGG